MKIIKQNYYTKEIEKEYENPKIVFIAYKFIDDYCETMNVVILNELGEYEEICFVSEFTTGYLEPIEQLTNAYVIDDNGKKYTGHFEEAKYIKTLINIDDKNKYLNWYAVKAEKELLESGNVFYQLEEGKKRYGMENLVFEVIKGRKYPIGTRFTPKRYFEKEIKGTYGHEKINYLVSDEIFVSITNCKLAEIRKEQE